jgi:hypothetical protein
MVAACASLDPLVGYRVAAGILFVVLLLLRVASMQSLELTTDEAGGHFRYGWQILHGDARRFDNGPMPVTVLNTLPRAVASLFPAGALHRRLAKVETGRYVTVALTLGLGAIVLCWTRALYGRAGALLALTLYTFDPNLLAHSVLITTDLYATAAVTLFLYAYWRYLEEGGMRLLLGTALLLGVAQIAKYTCIYLFPVVAIIAIGRAVPDLKAALGCGRLGALRSHVFRFVAIAILFIVASVVVINIGFLFDRTLMPFHAYRFRSGLFRSAQLALNRFGAIPIPVPYPYLEGLDWSAMLERTGHYANIYLFGKLDGPDGWHGFKGYYFFVGLFKVPIAIQILIGAVLIAYVRRWRRFDFWRREWLLLCPVVFYAIYFNFFYRLNIGFRHILIIFPLLYIFCGSLLADARSVPRWARVGLAGLLVYLFVSVLSYFPHFIPYFNELVWDRKQAYRIAADSNLDWGQGYHTVTRWLRRHPDAVLEPDGPMAGTIVVRVNALVGINPYERFRWLRDNFEPVDHVAYSHLVFRITAQDLERITRP